MEQVLEELNNDQLDGLARLCFDLGKVAFILALFPAPSIPNDPVIAPIKMLIGLFWGLVFVYLALVILRVKRGYK